MSETALAPFNQGNIRFREGNFAAAAAAYQQAVSHDPSFGQGWHNLGCACERLGAPAQAIAAYKKAVSLAPEWGEPRFNLGCVLARVGRLHEAVPHLREATRLKQDDPGVLNNLGLALSLTGEAVEAEAIFREALRIDPRYSEAHNNLSVLYEQFGRITKAIDSCTAALGLRPDFPEALNNLGNAYKAQGRTAEALSSYRAALRVRPDYAEARSSFLFTLNYSADLPAETVTAEHVAFGAAYSGPVTAHPNTPEPGRPLRIGYLSGDFKNHAVMRFLEPVLKNHDSTRFEIYCYSNVATPDGTTEKVRAMVRGWRDICGVPDEAVEAMIRADAIDILVDLAGHTAGNRVTLLARKPAPLQVTWLGYPNTTGLTTVDYRITDAVADPPGMTETLHTEELLRLHGSFSCFAPPEDAPEAGELPCLRNGFVTFGSFNNPAKLSTETVRLWCAVLRALPASRMLIKGYSFADAGTCARLAAQFEKNGISASRLQLRGNTPRYADHLLLYREVDIALDSYPYNGTTTTCEALWMGVPVVTLAGSEHRSRVGASLMRALQLDELVADAPAGFEAAVVALAGDGERLRRLRGSLRERMASSPLLDGTGFTVRLEEAYRTIWTRWCIGRGSDMPQGREYLARGAVDEALRAYVAANDLAGVEEALKRCMAAEMEAALPPAGPAAPAAPTGPTAEALLQVAQHLLRHGFATPAELICRHLLERGKRDPLVHRTLGAIAAEVGDDAAAAGHYARAAQLGDRSTATKIAQLKATHNAALTPPPSAHRHLVIKAWGYGFWSDISHVLGGLLLAEITGRTPVIHWGGNSLFTDDPAQNAFERFFEPLPGPGIVRLAAPGRSYYPPKWHARNLHLDGNNVWNGAWSRFSALRALGRREDVVVSDFAFSVHDLLPWIPEEHPLHGREADDVSRELFRRYLRPRPEILQEAENFFAATMAGKKLLALHVRGGDKGGEDPNLQRLNRLYEPLATQFLDQNRDGRLFLITDDDVILRSYRGRYGARLIHTDATRTENEQGVHYQETASRYRLGVEVMVDVLLALRCDSFIGNGLSNVSCAVAQLKKWEPGTLTLLGARLDRLRNFTLYRS